MHDKTNKNGVKKLLNTVSATAALSHETVKNTDVHSLQDIDILLSSCSTALLPNMCKELTNKNKDLSNYAYGKTR